MVKKKARYFIIKGTAAFLSSLSKHHKLLCHTTVIASLQMNTLG